MSTLYLIRHGQASYGQADYDRLSARGEVPAWLAWALRPAALAAAAALLVVSVGTSVWWLESVSRQNVAEQLLAAGGANTTADFEVDLPSGAVNDSGAMQ